MWSWEAAAQWHQWARATLAPGPHTHLLLSLARPPQRVWGPRSLTVLVPRPLLSPGAVGAAPMATAWFCSQGSRPQWLSLRQKRGPRWAPGEAILPQPLFRVARCPWHASPSCRSGARLTLTLHPSTHTTELEVLRKTSPWAALGPAVKSGARLERSKFIDLSWWLLARFIAGHGLHSSALLTLITTGTWGVCACMPACVCKPSDLWTFYFCTTDPCHTTSISSRPPPYSQLPRRGPSGWSPLPLGGPGSRTIFPICPFNPRYSGVFLKLLVWGASISPVSPLGTLVSR